MRDIIQRVLAEHSVGATFAMLVPDDVSPPGYCLLLECDASNARNLSQDTMADDLDRRLRENPYYRHAVEIGQLAAVNVRLIDGPEPAALIYQRECVRRGQRLGNIKPLSIDSEPSWQKVFSRARSTVPS